VSDLPAEGASFLIFAGFAAGLFLLADTSTNYLVHRLRLDIAVIEQFIAAILFLIFMTVNIGNVLLSYGTFYKSDEVSFLLGLPISPGAIFAAKFLDNFVASSGILSIISIAVVSGCSAALGVPWYFHPFSVVWLHLPMLLLAGVVPITLVAILTRVADRFGFRRIISVLVFLYTAIMCGYFWFFNPFDNTILFLRSGLQPGFLGVISPPSVARFLPTQWVAEYIRSYVLGDSESALASLGKLWGAVLVAFIGAVVVGRSVFYRAWLAASGAPSVSIPVNAEFRPGLFSLGRAGIRNRQSDVFFKRDVLMFIREPGQWIHLLIMLLLILAFTLSLRSYNIDDPLPAERAVVMLCIFLFNGFFTSSLALRFIFPATSSEGEAFWCVRSAPVDLRRLYYMKAVSRLAGLMVASGVVSVISMAMAGTPLGIGAPISIVFAFASAAVGAMHYAAGTVYARFKERNPIMVASSKQATLTFLVSIVFYCIETVLIAAPVFYEAAHSSTGYDVGGSRLVPLLLAIIFSCIVIVQSMLKGVSTFSGDFQS
jgi:ABC-2 type transport system permease protein